MAEATRQRRRTLEEEEGSERTKRRTGKSQNCEAATRKKNKQSRKREKGRAKQGRGMGKRGAGKTKKPGRNKRRIKGSKAGVQKRRAERKTRRNGLSIVFFIGNQELRYEDDGGEKTETTTPNEGK